MEDKIILTKSEFEEIFYKAFEMGIQEGKVPSTNLKSWEIARFRFRDYVETLPKGIRFLLEEE